MNYSIIQLRNYDFITQIKFYSKAISKSEVYKPAMYESYPNDDGLYPAPDSFTSIVLWSVENPVALIVMDLSVQDITHIKLETNLEASYVIDNDLVLNIKNTATSVEVIEYSDIDDLSKLIKPKYSPYESGEYERITRKLVKSSDYTKNLVLLAESSSAFVREDDSGRLYTQSYLRGASMPDYDNSSQHPIVIDQLTDEAFYVEDLINPANYDMFIMYGYRLIVRRGVTYELYDLRSPSTAPKSLPLDGEHIQFIDMDTIGGPGANGTFRIIDLDERKSYLLDYHDLMNFRVTIDNNDAPWYYHKGIFYTKGGKAV